MADSMDTLTIEIRNPKVRELMANLADMGLISILSQPTTWAERWQALSAELPDTSAISEGEIMNEIGEVRQQRQIHE